MLADKNVATLLRETPTFTSIQSTMSFIPADATWYGKRGGGIGGLCRGNPWTGPQVIRVPGLKSPWTRDHCFRVSHSIDNWVC